MRSLIPVFYTTAQAHTLVQIQGVAYKRAYCEPDAPEQHPRNKEIKYRQCKTSWVDYSIYSGLGMRIERCLCSLARDNSNQTTGSTARTHYASRFQEHIYIDAIMNNYLQNKPSTKIL